MAEFVELPIAEFSLQGLAPFVEANSVTYTVEQQQITYSQSNAVFEFFNIEVNFQLPDLNIDVEIAEPFSIAVNFQLPLLDFDYVSGFDIGFQLPELQFQSVINNDQINVNFQLPPPQLDLFINRGDFSINVFFQLPPIQFELFTAARVEFQLPELSFETDFEVLTKTDINFQLPQLSFEYISAFDEFLNIDFQLPPIQIQSQTRTSIQFQLPSLQFITEIDNTLNEAIAYVVNLQHGGITQYDNYNFEKLGYVKGKCYGLRNGKLYKLQTDTDAGQKISASFLTHIDDRMFNDIGELVSSQKLRHCYGALISGRIEKGLEITTVIDEDDGDVYSMNEENFVKKGVDLFEVDFYRGPIGHYWGVGLQNVDGDRNTIKGISLYLKEDDSKVWT